MMHALRIFFGLFLALTVALTAHSAAARQGERDAAGRMVICTGTGPLTIYVDSEGQPVKPPHSCPDCMMHALDAVAPPEALLLPAEAGGTVTAVRLSVPRSLQLNLNASARAPPRAA